METTQMKRLLGIRISEHDSNFSYYDGKSLKYYKSERLHNIKHHAFDDLNTWVPEVEKIFGIVIEELDAIAIILDEWTFPPEYITEISSISPFCKIISTPSSLFGTLPSMYCINHHYGHVLSTLEGKYTGNHIIIDGFGELGVSWTVLKNGIVVDEGDVAEDGSIGIAMSDIARAMGVQAEHSIDLAGKVMGLQAYGEIDQKYLLKLSECSIKDISRILDYDGWIKHIGSPLLAQHSLLDWSATLHFKLGEVILELFEKYFNPKDPVYYTGGAALNVVWNTSLLERFPKMYIPPHTSDEGLSLGAVEFLRIEYGIPVFEMNNFPYIQSDEVPITTPSEETIKEVAKRLGNGEVVGWYQGAGEIGPRALGNRSILMSPYTNGELNCKYKINKIKNREGYRPFGASVLENSTLVPEGFKNPYMLYISKGLPTNLDCISHIDGTCRVQTVSKNDNIYFHKLLETLKTQERCEILLNTSLNMAGGPIIGEIKDALLMLHSTDIDCMVIGDSIYV